MFGLFKRKDKFNKELKKYIKKNLIIYKPKEKSKKSLAMQTAKSKASFEIDDIQFDQIMENSFSSTLLDFIDAKNMSDVDCYKNANIDRKLFSKIRSQKDYKPSKNTVFAFAISLKLNKEETNKLLSSAGYTLSHSFVTDIIIEYFISKKRYDIMKVNEVLYEYGQPLLGSVS